MYLLLLLTLPFLASSGLASSGLASSGLASSGLASSGLASSGMASSDLLAPPASPNALDSHHQSPFGAPVSAFGQAVLHQDGEDPGTHWHPALVAGTRGMGGDAHLFGGLTLGAHRGDFGAGATFHLGGGNDYRSVLAGAGPSAKLIEVAGVSLSSWVGVGHLRERLLDNRAPAGTEAADRSVTGAVATLSARRPLPVGALTAQVLLLAGQSDGPDFNRTPWVSTTRFTVGFGW